MLTASEQAEALFAEGYKDNRQAARIPFHLPIQATVYQGSTTDSGISHVAQLFAHDLSGGGISLISEKRLINGQRMELEMPDRLRAAMVHHVASIGSGHYLVRCKFIKSKA